jgi:uncharacterized protein
MSILETIDRDLKDSLRAKNEVKLGTLRMLKSDIMYEKARGTEDLSEEKVIEVLMRSAKKRKEAMHEYTKAGRKDLADKEAAELVIIELYLPTQMSEQELSQAIDTKLKELGEVSKKDFGKIMSALMKDLKGQADGAMVKKLLTQKMESL